MKYIKAESTKDLIACIPNKNIILLSSYILSLKTFRFKVTKALSIGTSKVIINKMNKLSTKILREKIKL